MMRKPQRTGRRHGIDVPEPDAVSQGEYLAWQDESTEGLTPEYLAWLQRKRDVTNVTVQARRTRAILDT